MNLRHLRTFVQITEAGGVARAAGRLNLSQPTVSRQIRALEDALGLPLFDRVGRNVQLTSEAKICCGAAANCWRMRTPSGSGRARSKGETRAFSAWAPPRSSSKVCW